MTKWIREHKEVISLLLVVALALLGAFLLAGVFIAIASVLHVL